MAEEQVRVQRPRFRLVANGERISGCVSVSVTDNNHLAADKWQAEVSLGLDPARDLAFWTDNVDVECEVLAGFLPDDQPEGGEIPWKSLILGGVDDVEVDLVAGVVRLNGRDKTAEFVDAQIIEAFPNRTASELAQEFAARHDMDADVTPTSTRVGQHYSNEHMGSASNFGATRTEWDLLTFLAEAEGYDVWVEGRTLFFHPSRRNEDEQPVGLAVVLGVADTNGLMSSALVGAVRLGQATATSLKRSLSAAKDIEVTVQSADVRNGKRISATVRGNGRASSSAGAAPRRARRGAAAEDVPASVLAIPLEGDPNEGRRVRSRASRGPRSVRSPPRANSKVSRYRITVPGIDQAEALKRAGAKLDELSSHERKVDVRMPGELDLTARVKVRMTGTGTSFDQDYYVEEVERRISVASGFEQSVRLSNTSPRDKESATGDAELTPMAGGGRSSSSIVTPDADADEIPVPNMP